MSAPETKISSFPFWWHARSQNRHLWLLSLQEMYGTTFRHHPNAVCINTPSAYHQIYGPRGNVKKGLLYEVWQRTVEVQNTWSTTSIEIHTRKRRVLNHAFSDSTLRGAEPFIHSNVDRWLDLLCQHRHDSREWSKSIDMADQVTYVLFDILGDLCFDQSSDLKEPESDLRYVLETINGFVETVHSLSMSPWAPVWVWLKPYGLDKLLALATPPAIKSWDAFVAICQESRAEKQSALEQKFNSEKRRDFFHWLWEAKDPDRGEGYSISELSSACELLVIAGSDAMAMVVAGLFFYLSHDQEAQNRLAKEIAATFSSYDEIRAGTKLRSCSYLTAYGQYFPHGSSISTACWATHYNADYFHEPYQFLPDRWMAEEAGATAQSVAVAEGALCFFSTSPHGCIGKKLAWQVMRLIMAKVFWKFQMRQDPNRTLRGGTPNAEWGRYREGQYQTWDMFGSKRKGPIIQLRERARGDQDAGNRAQRV
ncbi:cytochrome P450 [Setomelanomma holmii]|uniref:Cytochrome P450 n=1 Tax=Setomelanomma holmii TaxID=210430 RepID=A0A9P4H7D7_9PLEO|nr:cytochrome P450 [Setomelanomma holmii]